MTKIMTTEQAIETYQNMVDFLRACGLSERFVQADAQHKGSNKSFRTIKWYVLNGYGPDSNSKIFTGMTAFCEGLNQKGLKGTYIYGPIEYWHDPGDIVHPHNVGFVIRVPAELTLTTLKTLCK